MEKENLGKETTYIISEVEKNSGKKLRIAYARVFVSNCCDNERDCYEIKPQHKKADTKKFFDCLYNVFYNNGYGEDYVHGFIVFTDGSWIERNEYDGSEWWEYKQQPNF